MPAVFVFDLRTKPWGRGLSAKRRAFYRDFFGYKQRKGNRVYEYPGLLGRIPKPAWVRLNDSTYLISDEYERDFEGVFEKYNDIIKSVYKLKLGKREQLEIIKAESLKDKTITQVERGLYGPWRG